MKRSLAAPPGELPVLPGLTGGEVHQLCGYGHDNQRPSESMAVIVVKAMRDEPYGALAGVYDWLIPDELFEPAGSAAAFAGVIKDLRPGARVLDCAAGTGQLAVGLAGRGFDVVASDASDAMIQRTRALAARHGTPLQAVSCAWEDLTRKAWQRNFDAVFCVGNSLAHAVGGTGRRAALTAMSSVLREDGTLVLTSRNWERLRDAKPGLQVADRLVERTGRRGLVIYAWEIPDSWQQPHNVVVAVADVTDANTVTTRSERLTFWPFRRDTLDDDLQAAGLAPAFSTYAADADRYLITARRHCPAQ